MNARRAKALKKQSNEIAGEDDLLYWQTYRRLKKEWSSGGQTSSPAPARQRRRKAPPRQDRGVADRDERDRLLRQHKELRDLPWMPLENLRRKARVLGGDDG